MSKLKALLEKPVKPNEKFHSLESHTPTNKMPKEEIWDLIAGLLEHTDVNRRILGVYLNSVLTENKTTHLLSGKLISRLLKTQSLIERKTLSNKHAASLLGYFESEGIIEILRPVIEGKKAAVVRVILPEICDYVNMQIGKEISDSYKASVLSYYDAVPYPVPLESSTTTTSNNINNTTIENSSSGFKEAIKGKSTELDSKQSVHEQTPTNPANPPVALTPLKRTTLAVILEHSRSGEVIIEDLKGYKINPGKEIDVFDLILDFNNAHNFKFSDLDLQKIASFLKIELDSSRLAELNKAKGSRTENNAPKAS